MESFPSKYIGRMCNDTFKQLFPLVPSSGSGLRDDIRRVRALNVLWGELPGYNGARGAWMPLSAGQQMDLYKRVGLFDEKYKVPKNPWCVHNGQGIMRVYNQSYHSVYHTDSYKAEHFSEWQVCVPLPVPREGRQVLLPLLAVRRHARVRRLYSPSSGASLQGARARHAQLMYNRFGFTGPMRLGQQMREDTGLLQDMFSFEYRKYAQLTPEQRKHVKESQTVEETWMSNLRPTRATTSSSRWPAATRGTEEPSKGRIVRNLYRMYVDSYRCMGLHPKDDGVPCVMGFLPHGRRRPRRARRHPVRGHTRVHERQDKGLLREREQPRRAGVPDVQAGVPQRLHDVVHASAAP